jgi:hypothetical protein
LGSHGLADDAGALTSIVVIALSAVCLIAENAVPDVGSDARRAASTSM